MFTSRYPTLNRPEGQGNVAGGFTTRIPKTVYLLRPRQLTASLEDIDRVHYCADKLQLQNHVAEYDTSKIRRTKEDPNIAMGHYKSLTKEELPRCRRRTEISGKSQSRNNPEHTSEYQRVSETYTIQHKKSTCCRSCCKIEEGNYAASESDEEKCGLRESKRHEKRKSEKKASGHKRKPKELNSEEKSKSQFIPVQKLGILTRQMQSRYLSQVENQLYNAINILVYKNGLEDMIPILIHIPPHRKTTMHGIMAAIQERVRFPIGYAKILYTMDGTKLIYSYQLKNHGEYVVATNLHKRFQAMQYGRRRTPLMMIGKESKHIRNLKHIYQTRSEEDGITQDKDHKEEDAAVEIKQLMIEESQQKNDVSANRVKDSLKKQKSITEIVSLKKEMLKDKGHDVSNVQEETMNISYCNAGVGTTCSHCNTSYFGKYLKEQNLYNEYLPNHQSYIITRNKRYENTIGNSTVKTSSIGSQCDKSIFRKEYENGQSEDESAASVEIRRKKRYGINRELGNQKPIQGTYALNSDEPSCKREGRYGKSKSSHKTHNYCTRKERLPQPSSSEGTQCLNKERIEKRRSFNKDEDQYLNDMMKKVQYNQSSGDAPLGSSVPKENIFNPNKTDAHVKQNLLCTIPCGEGLSKLNVLPCFTYNLPSQTPQQTYMVQQHPPIQIQHQQHPQIQIQHPQLQLQPVQSPQIALGHHGILGVPDSWNQQIYLPNPQLIAAQMPTNAQFMQLTAPNFQITPSAYTANVGINGLKY